MRYLRRFCKCISIIGGILFLLGGTIYAQKRDRILGGLSVGVSDYGMSVGSLSKALVDQFGRKIIDDHAASLGIGSRDLLLKSIDSSHGRWMAEYAQSIDGIPIEYTEVRFTIGRSGRILNIGSRIYENAKCSVHPAIDALSALNYAEGDFRGEKTIVRGHPEMVIVPMKRQNNDEYRLAWKTTLEKSHPFPEYTVYYIDALDGHVLQKMKVEANDVRPEGKISPSQDRKRSNVPKFSTKVGTKRVLHPGTRNTATAIEPDACDLCVQLSPGNCGGGTYVLPGGTIGDLYDEYFTVEDGSGIGSGNYTFSIDQVPAGLTFQDFGDYCELAGTIAGAPHNYSFTIDVVDNTDNTCYGFQDYSLATTCLNLTLFPASGNLPDGYVGTQYTTVDISASGGSGSYTYSATAGSLPPGITLQNSGELGGTPTMPPTVPKTYSFTVTATDQNAISCTVSSDYNLTINKYGTISGNITGTVWKTYSNAAADQNVPLDVNPVVLYNSLDVQVDFTHTDVNGHYSFTNLELDDYTVKANLINSTVGTVDDYTNQNYFLKTSNVLSVTGDGVVLDGSFPYTDDENGAHLYYHMTWMFNKYFLQPPFNDGALLSPLPDGYVNNQCNCAAGVGNSTPTFVSFGSYLNSTDWVRSRDIVAHECSHIVIFRIYKIGNDIGDRIDMGQPGIYPQGDAMEEGFADYFAVVSKDPALIVPQFAPDALQGQGPGLDPRTLQNNLALGANYTGGDFTGEPHHDGQIISGALWDLYQSNAIALSDQNRLIYEALEMKPRSFHEFLYDLYAVDDDDFPASQQAHFTAIQGAFANHGMWSNVVPMLAGWNMTGVPNNAFDLTTASLYPHKLGTTYAYSAGYQPVNAMVDGLGYWVKYPTAPPDRYAWFVGTPMPSVNINLVQGWNMVGSVDHLLNLPADAHSAVTTGYYFGYHGGYYVANQITPGNGYWIRATQAGQLTLGQNQGNGAFAYTPQLVPCPFYPIPAPITIYPPNAVSSQPLADTLIWDNYECARWSRVQVSKQSTFDTLLVNDSLPTTILTRQLTGLSPGTTYYWRVEGGGIDDNYVPWTSPWSAVWSFTTGSPPSAPTLASPTNGASSQPSVVVFSWNTSSLAATYRIQVSSNSGFGSTMLDDSTLTGTSRQSVPLAFNTTYYWRVNAKNACGTSAWSGIWNFTTGNPPSAPALSSPSNGATNQATTLTAGWNASTGATQYWIQVSVNSNFAAPAVNDSAVASTSRQIGPLDGSTTYYWRVAAINNIGTGPWSSTWSFTTVVTSPPAIPTLSSPTNNATGVSISPTLVWNAAAYATSYRVQVSMSSEFGSFIVNDSVTTTSRSVSSVDYSTTYYWRVYSKNNVGSSAWSSTWAFTTGREPCEGDAAISSLDQLVISDQSGGSQVLYVRNTGRGIDSSLGASNEMPPQPARGIYSARFRSGKFIEGVPPNQPPSLLMIQVQNATPPIVLGWYIQGDNRISYQLAMPGNRRDKINLTGSGSLTVDNNSAATLVVTAQAIDPCLPLSSVYQQEFEQESAKPRAYVLYQNTPNPFNPSTIIRYDLPEDGHVTLRIYNILGQEVKTLVDEQQTAGYRSVVLDGKVLPTGVYFYRLQVGMFTDIKKMLLMK